jgi:hypothetical protein
LPFEIGEGVVDLLPKETAEIIFKAQNAVIHSIVAVELKKPVQSLQVCLGVHSHRPRGQQHYEDITSL